MWTQIWYCWLGQWEVKSNLRYSSTMSLDAMPVYPNDATLHCALPGSCSSWQWHFILPVLEICALHLQDSSCLGVPTRFINTRSQPDELLVAECKTTCSPRFSSPLFGREDGSDTYENLTNSGEQLKLTPFLLQMGLLLRDTELICLICHAWCKLAAEGWVNTALGSSWEIINV